MINFQPSEEQYLLRQTLRGFAREVVRPAAREADEKEVVPTPVVAKSWELGLVQDAIPEAMGGFGSPRSAIAGTFILEELAYGSLGITLHLVAPRLFTVLGLSGHTLESSLAHWTTIGASSRTRPSSTRAVGPAMLTVPTALPSGPDRTAAATAVTPGSASLSAKP